MEYASFLGLPKLTHDNTMFCEGNLTEKELLNSINWSQMKKEFSVSQKQAIIKLIEEKGKDKRYKKNWRPVSLLNVDNNIV